MPDRPLDPQDLDDFGRLDALLRAMAPPVELPVSLRARTLAAVADPIPASRSWRWRMPSRRLMLGGVGALAAAMVVLVIALGGSGDDGPPLELRAALQAPGRPAVAADAEVFRLDVGRVVEFHTDKLPVLPKGKYYELWFVGAGDSPTTPNRISAGTFHPDPQGRSDVRFAAAVDPKKYPILSVTAEPGNGDPRPSRREVLRSRAGG